MRYEAPTTTKEAASLLAEEKGDAYILAGGTDLLVRMKMDMIEPDLVVDIKHIPAMQKIKTSPTGTTIGAAVSGAQLGSHKALKKMWPGVVEATNLIGSDQVQGRCTMVGNLCNASPAADSVPAMI
ncbi:MAG: carbon-monoxide dehydrogenase medium subunit, partial [Oceanicoccus sp.]